MSGCIARVCVCTCVCMCMRACVCEWVRERQRAFLKGNSCLSVCQAWDLKGYKGVKEEEEGGGWRALQCLQRHGIHHLWKTATVCFFCSMSSYIFTILQNVLCSQLNVSHMTTCVLICRKIKSKVREAGQSYGHSFLLIIIFSLSIISSFFFFIFASSCISLNF